MTDKYVSIKQANWLSKTYKTRRAIKKGVATTRTVAEKTYSVAKKGYQKADKFARDPKTKAAVKKFHAKASALADRMEKNQRKGKKRNSDPFGIGNFKF